MTCTSPLLIKSKPPLSKTFEVPCSKCMNCRIRRTAEWTKRILDESEGKESCFVTLTYEDKFLPLDFSLKKDHIQKFFKRLRKKLKEKTIKYYACGEYGDSTLRPHYHAIIIGWRPDFDSLRKINENVVTSTELSKLWKFGFNTVGNLTKESAQYVTGYIRKKQYGKKDYNPYYPREAPFCISSKELGFEYAKKNFKRILKGETVNGKNLGIPRYYLKKLATKKDMEFLTDKQLDNEAKKLEDFDNYYDFQKARNLDMARREADANSKELLFQKSKI